MRRDPDLLRGGLERIAAAHLRRSVLTVARSAHEPDDVHVTAGGRRLVNFCSNDYLGLARHPALIAAFQSAAGEEGVGSGAAHGLGGHTPTHQALEEELAAFTGRERALLFSTGYMANLGVVTSFTARHEVMLQDRLNHASLVDGAHLSAARLVRYPHLDADAVRRLLLQHPQTTLLATDGVFSMDGDIAPLRQLADHCRAHAVWLMVDDAHGLGVLGARGGGSVSDAALTPWEVPLLMGTLGKALGCFGAFVAGDADVIDWLLQRARSYRYTTALPPAVAAAARVALRLCASESWRRERLQLNVQRLRRGAAELGIALDSSTTAIQPLRIGAADTAMRWGEALQQRGFFVGVTRPPTVPEHAARLRITLSCLHTDAQIDALLESLALLARGRDAARMAS
jgi:8-amino-7-oxononanoate synthase